MDGRVDLWDVSGRRWIRALTDGEYRHQGRVAFSPVRNLLAATSEPKVVALYDLDSGRESVLWRAPDQGVWDVKDLSFSQDGSKVVIYAGGTGKLGDEVWVVNVSSAQIESRHPTDYSVTPHHGAARLSPDNQRLYLARSDRLNNRYSIQCLDLITGKELWQTERERDLLTTLAISPDGQLLASGSGYEDPTIRIWEAATGRILVRLDGHTSWVCKLAFSRDGRRLISAAADQSIRFWDTTNWTETQVLRGHTDEVHAVAISEPAQLVASASKDGDLMLWRDDGKSATDGYRRLPKNLQVNQVLPLDHSRVLLLPPGQPTELVDLKHDSAPVPLLAIGSSTNILGCLSTNLLCLWNGTNQILVRELRGAEFIQRGVIALDSGIRPTGFAYNPALHLLAWTEGTSSASVCLASLLAPGRQVELRSDVPGFVPFRFSENGNYLAASTRGGASLRVWNVETGQIVASINETFNVASFAAGGRVLVVAIARGNDHEIRFYNLANPDRAARRVPWRHSSGSMTVSPDGGVVASATQDGQVRLFDPAKGELIGSLHGHLNAVYSIAFSPDGRRLISTSSGGREAVKLWDVGTRQELLTLGGTGSLFEARWSADGDVILAGVPWQAWRAPSWVEIEAAEKAARMTP
jgi:WD40 repeat protein